MCGNPFKSPKTQTVTVEKPVEKVVEKVADPAPVAVKPTDTGSTEARMDLENEKQRKKKGYAATRVAADRSVLTDSAQGAAGRTTLG